MSVDSGATSRGARAAAVFVWALWLAMTAYAVYYVAHYGSGILFLDDISLVDGVRSRGVWFWQWLWAQHNEHRIPLPHVLCWGLYALTGDVRSNSYGSIAVLAATAAAMMVFAARRRGRASFLDSFFPLIWLHTGNAENLLMGFQLSLMLPTGLVCAIVLVSIARGKEMRPRDALVCGLSLVGLPLCGGPGMLQGPPLALWLAAVGLANVRSTDRTARRAGLILLASVVTTGAIGVVYLIGFHLPPNASQSHDVLRVLDLAERIVALAIGQAADPWWPWSGHYVVAVAISAAIVALIAFRTKPNERWRAAAVLVGLATTACLVVGMGVGRGGGTGTPGFANRYVGLPAPILCTAFLGWLVFGRPLARTIVHTSLVLVLIAAHWFVNWPLGIDYGTQKHRVSTRFEREVAAGMKLRALTLDPEFAVWMDPLPDRLLVMLRFMVAERMYPFEDPGARSNLDVVWPMFEATPIRLEGVTASSERPVEGVGSTLMMPGESLIVFDVPAPAMRFIGRIGTLDAAWKAGRCPPVRVQIVARRKDGTPVTLVDRVLDPERVEADRGIQPLSIPLEPGTLATIAVRVSKAGDARAQQAWIWINGVDFVTE